MFKKPVLQVEILLQNILLLCSGAESSTDVGEARAGGEDVVRPDRFFGQILVHFFSSRLYKKKI